MRILCATEATGWTGGVNQIRLTLLELARRGYSAAVACRPGTDVERRLRAAGLETLPVRFRQDYDVPAAWSLARQAKAWGATIVHAHHPKAHAVALLAAVLFGLAPLVVSRHVIYRVGRNPLSAWKYRSRRIQAYAAVCNETAARLTAAGVEPGRITRVPPGVDLAPWLAARARRDGRFDCDVLTVGHHGPAKGQDVLVRAAALLKPEHPGLRVRVVGRGTDALGGLVRELGVESQVELLGERADVPELMARARLYAMPSRQEGLATVLIEAQTVGVPVVASRVGGLPEAVEDGVNGLLVPPESPDALAGALGRLLRDPSLGARLSEAGMASAEAGFSIASAADRLEALYKKVAAGGADA